MPYREIIFVSSLEPYKKKHEAERRHNFFNVKPGGTSKPKHWVLKGQMFHPCRFGCVLTAASK
jgi:hypothetical protein